VTTPAPPARARRRTTPKSRQKDLVKVPTGIVGLDQVLGGGLPAGRMTLLSGGPGSGKSLIGLQWLLDGARSGEPGILVLFEERAAAVRQNALSLGWDLAALERTHALFLFDARIDPDSVTAGDFSITGLLAILDHQIKARGARRIVIDAVDMLLQLYSDGQRERRELHVLHEWLLDRGVTAIMTVKATPDEPSVRYSFLDFMADCVIHADQRVEGQVATRRLRVVKYRGSGYGRNEYPFIIGTTGINVIPITSNTLQHRAPGPRVSTGQPRLDELLAGGYRTGTSIMLAGTAGAGKTTLACVFAAAAARRGERVLYISFEESPESIISNMRSSGLVLRPLIAKGTLVVQAFLPEAMGVEEHLVHALTALDALHPRHVIVDAISACRRMGSERAAFEYLMRVVNACKERGITCMYLNQLTRPDGLSEISGIGISSLIDVVILLRQLSIDGAMTRQLVVVKARGSKHSEQFHGFRITDHGLDLATA